jgi:rhodanese-related sulfurtransferase
LVNCDISSAAFILAAVLLTSNTTYYDNQRSSQSPEATLVDVRTPGEVAMEPVPGAINIPLDEVPTRWEEFQAMPRPLVVFCRSGTVLVKRSCS